MVSRLVITQGTAFHVWWRDNLTWWPGGEVTCGGKSSWWRVDWIPKKGREQIKRTTTTLDNKNFLKHGGFFSQPHNISFTVNTDGVTKYSSSMVGHLQPVYLMTNELPKEHGFRKKYTIPANIFCNKHNPNMQTLLNPLVEKLNTLHEPGILVPGSADGNITVWHMLFVATADLPARATFINMKQFNGKYACHLCKSEGAQ